MKLTLKSNDSLTIKRARSLCRRRVGHSRLTLRNGQLYTMRYNPGRQPRTDSQKNNWSLFKEANRLVAADFASPEAKNHWLTLHRKQSHYKTARGLARAHYIARLRSQMNAEHPVQPSSRRLPYTSLRPLFDTTPACRLSGQSGHRVHLVRFFPRQHKPIQLRC